MNIGENNGMNNGIYIGNDIDNIYDRGVININNKVIEEFIKIIIQINPGCDEDFNNISINTKKIIEAKIKKTSEEICRLVKKSNSTELQEKPRDIDDQVRSEYVETKMNQKILTPTHKGYHFDEGRVARVLRKFQAGGKHRKKSKKKSKKDKSKLKRSKRSRRR